MKTPERGAALTAAAVLFTLLALSNLSKPLELNPEQGFVFLGHRLRGVANGIMGPLFGLYLLAYAGGIWRMRRWALGMGVAYAGYVVVNLVCFTLFGPPQEGSLLFGLVYMLIAVGVSGGAAWLLARRREELV